MSAVMVTVVARLLVAGVCAAVAGLLALRGMSGWGWFLFAAVWLGAITVSSSSSGGAKVSE